MGLASPGTVATLLGRVRARIGGAGETVRQLGIAGKLLAMAATLLLPLTASLFYISRDLGGATRLIETQARTLERLETANAADRHFSVLQYWLTDLALNLEGISMMEVRTAQQKLDETLARLEKTDPELVGDLRPQLEDYVTT